MNYELSLYGFKVLRSLPLRGSRRGSWVLILLALSTLHASAQGDVLRYSLKECIDRGLENNLEIAIVRNDEAVARNNATLGNAGGLPTVDVSAALRPGLTAQDRTVARNSGDATSHSGYMDLTADAAVSLNWTLFDGFKIQTTYKQLQTLRQQGETATRMAIENLVADITSEYYANIQQATRVANYRYAMALSRERLRIAEINYQTGRFSGLEYHQAESDYRSDSTAYVRQQENLVNSNIEMNRLMGNINVDQTFVAIDSTIVINPHLDMEELWQQTLANNTSMLMASQNMLMAEQDLKKILSRDYPYLRLSTQYAYAHSRYGVSSTIRRDNHGLSGALTVGFNIFDGNRKRERTNARLKIENKRLHWQQLNLELRAQLTTLWKSYRNNLALIDLQRQNLSIATSNLEIAMERYKLGNLSGFDMRQVEKNLLDAEERVLEVEYAAKLCEISLMLISGQITLCDF